MFPIVTILCVCVFALLVVWLVRLPTGVEPNTEKHLPERPEQEIPEHKIDTTRESD